MFHADVAFSVIPYCLAGMVVGGIITERRLKAHRLAQNHERYLWSQYAALAARTAREQRGK